MIELAYSSPAARAETRVRVVKAWLRLKEKPPGFMDLELLRQGWRAVETHCANLNRLQGPVVCCGIGGSSLGARVLVSGAPGASRILFLENSDPHSAQQLWSSLGDPGQAKFIWISKSGRTLELHSHWSWIQKLMAACGTSLAKRSLVISDDGINPLTRWASSENVPRLSIPSSIGGRFSVFTPAGVLPAAIAGVDLADVEEGVEWALSQEELICDLAALAIEGWAREEWVTIFWSYSDRLKVFASWLQQLWAESLAKRLTRQMGPAPRVSFPVPAVGAIDQHSILQQVVEGARDKTVWLWRVRSLETSGPRLGDQGLEGGPHAPMSLGSIFAAQAEGTSQALGREQVSHVVLSWEGQEPRHLSGAMMLFSLVIGVLGEALDINAYDQPGVELGKRLTMDLITNRIAE